MALTKAQKQKIVEDLKEKIDRQKAIVFGDIAGIKVGDLTKLRREMKQQENELKVAKKTLISRAFKEKGLEINFKKMTGEIALGFGYRDEIAPFKIFYNFSKENENLKILGGLIGKELFPQEKALVLAKLPSRQELLSKMTISLSSPLFGFINVLQGNIKGLITVLAKAKT